MGDVDISCRNGVIEIARLVISYVGIIQGSAL